MNYQSISTIHETSTLIIDLNSSSECHLLREFLPLFQNTEPTSRELGIQYATEISVLPERKKANKKSTFSWMFNWF